ncbi:MAG TPA: hypothetical protein VFE30_07310 [Anaeromyxobacteraceae bacterium]|jgi:hypothetical protein|nr:hypothetical protein [Anaeromyxobacteraceae bacterium]
MKSLARQLGSMALAVALTPPLAAAARGGPGRVYDPGTVTTVRGEVLEVQRVAAPGGEGVHLILAVGSERLAVHLGPAFYLDRQELKLAKGDQVEVKGSRVTLRGAPALIAQEVRRDGKVLALRNEAGVPLWSRQRAGRL